MVHPEYGSSENGYLSRFKSSISVTSVNQAGYVVWFPDFTGGNASSASTINTNGSLFFYNSTSSSVAPTNTTAEPLGMSATLTSTRGSFRADPAHAWVASSACQDARTVSACMQFQFTGAMSTTQGRFGMVEGITREMLLTGTSGGPPTADELFAVASHVERMPLDVKELKYRPSLQGEFFRTEALNSLTSAANDSADACYTVGIGGSNKTTLHATGMTSGGVLGLAFVYTGLDPSTAAFTVTFTKAIEWRPEIGQGMVLNIPRSVGDGTNIAQKTVALLDKHIPNWQSMMRHGAAHLGNALAKTVLGGSTLEIGARALKMLM